MAEVLEWVELPKGHGGRKLGIGGRPRIAMASLQRSPIGGECLRIERSLLTAIGTPKHVTLVMDARRCRLALRPSDMGGRSVHAIKQRNHSEVSASGVSVALGFAGRQGPVYLRAAIKDGMILMEPIALPVACAACGGSGVTTC